MGAFDGELYQLGFRFSEPIRKENPISKEVAARRQEVENMHVAQMPCPGSCGSVCPNHFCSSHNGQQYDWVVSYIVRHKFTLYQADQFRSANGITVETV